LEPGVNAVSERLAMNREERMSDRTIGMTPSVSQHMQLLMQKQHISPMTRAMDPNAALAQQAAQQQEMQAARQGMGLAPGDSLL